jgi:uncharacterized membrane protein YeiH
MEFQAYAAGTLRAFELLGVFVFALSGAVAGVKKHLDLFGVLVLSFAAATAGGILRDLLIGAIPPAAFKDLLYLAASLLAGLLIFFWFPRSRRERWQKMNNLVLIFDAGGLALFAVTGAQKALGFGLNPGMSAIMGMLTGIGGGMLRDLLTNEIPIVLTSELYAVAALAGASVVVIGHLLKLPPGMMAIAGAVLCFVLRVLAIRRGWNLPMALPPEQHPEDSRNRQIN